MKYKERLQQFKAEKKKLIDKELTAFQFEKEIIKLAEKYKV